MGGASDLNTLRLDHRRDGRVYMPLSPNRSPKNLTPPPRLPRSTASPVNIDALGCFRPLRRRTRPLSPPASADQPSPRQQPILAQSVVIALVHGGVGVGDWNDHGGSHRDAKQRQKSEDHFSHHKSPSISRFRWNLSLVVLVRSSADRKPSRGYAESSKSVFDLDQTYQYFLTPFPLPHLANEAPNMREKLP